MEPLLRTDHLTRVVDGARRVVDDISIAIRSGEVVAITGHSGSGKSSFMRLLNRLDEPTSGTVFLEGKDYRSVAPRDLRRRLGLVMQTPYLFPGTIADNLQFGPAQRGQALPAAEISHWLEQVGLAGCEDNNVSRLSGGEAQRVSIARTLANGPEIILLDEPTSALDEQSKEDVEILIRDLISRKKLTCLIVTHDAAQAARLAGRLILIEQGRLVSDQPTSSAAHA